MQPIIYLYYAYFDAPLGSACFAYYIGTLSSLEQEKIKRFQRWEDQHASLLGKLLLQQAMKDVGFEQGEMLYTASGKPYFNGLIDFNISHSGNYAVCAVSGGARVGVDIEKIKPIVISDFNRVLTDRELEIITRSQNPMADFYNTWTRKESIIKADGIGMGADLKNIDTTENSILLNGTTWHLEQIMLHPGYALHICFDKPALVRIKKVDFI